MTRVAGSNYQLIKSAVVAALSARPGLSGVQVTYSTPAKITSSTIFFDSRGPGASIDQNIRVMTGPSTVSNPHRVLETVTIPLVIQAVSQTDVEAADIEAVRMLAEVQQAFAGASQMVPSCMWVQLSGGDVESDVTEQRRPYCRMDLQVQAMAELFPDP